MHNSSASADSRIEVHDDDQSVVMDVLSDSDSENEEPVHREDEKTVGNTVGVAVESILSTSSTHLKEDMNPSKDLEGEIVATSLNESTVYSAPKTQMSQTSACCGTNSVITDDRTNSMLEELLENIKYLKRMFETRNSIDSSTAQAFIAAADAAELLLGGTKNDLESSLPVHEVKQQKNEEPRQSNGASSDSPQEYDNSRPKDIACEPQQEDEDEIFIDAAPIPVSHSSSTTTDVNIQSAAPSVSSNQTAESNVANQQQDEQPKYEQPQETDFKRSPLQNGNEQQLPPGNQQWTSFQYQGSQTGGYLGDSNGFAYISPVFTAGQTAPVFFPQCSSSSSVPPNMTTNRSSTVPRATGSAPVSYSGTSSSPSTAIPLPYPPCYPIPPTTGYNFMPPPPPPMHLPFGIHPPPPHGMHPPPPMTHHGLHHPPTHVMHPHGMHPHHPQGNMFPPRQPPQNVFGVRNPTAPNDAPSATSAGPKVPSHPPPPNVEVDTGGPNGDLPPPLLPERTNSARHAALLSTIGAAAATAIQSLGATASMASAATAAAMDAATAAASAATADLDNLQQEKKSEDASRKTATSSDANNRDQEGPSNGRPHTRPWSYGPDDEFLGQGFFSGLLQGWGHSDADYGVQQQHELHHQRQLLQQQKHHVKHMHKLSSVLRKQQQHCRQQMQSAMHERMRAHRQMTNVAAMNRQASSSSGRHQNPEKLFDISPDGYSTDEDSDTRSDINEPQGRVCRHVPFA